MIQSNTLCRAAPADRPAESIAPCARAATADFSPIEWMVVELARHDGTASIRPPSLLRRLGAHLFGLDRVNPLADPRLESLRRVAIHGWRLQGSIPDEEVDRFLAAGFSFDQLMLVFSAIEARLG